MRLFLIILNISGILYSTSVSAEVFGFQVKIKPGSEIPSLNVHSDHPSKIKYNRSRSELVEYDIEVRGRCVNSNQKLKYFWLTIGDQTVLNIPVSGENRSLTGNHGNQWETHRIRAGFVENNSPMISACNAEAVELLQNQSHDQVFNANFVTGIFQSDQRVRLNYSCTNEPGFADYVYNSSNLPLKAICEATGYQSQLRVTDSQLSLSPITGQDGTCKLNMRGGFQTGYELYALRSNQSTASLRYRFKYQGSGTGTNIDYSQWWEKVANPVNGGSFLFNYTDRLPSSISGGQVSLEVDIDGQVYSSGNKPFSIDCSEALPLQQTQTLDLALSVSADKTETVAIGGQLCPTHAILNGQVDAGYPINGNLLIFGSNLFDLYVQPIELAAGQNTNQQRRVKLNWPAADKTLALNAGAVSNSLKKQDLEYGLRVTNSSSVVVESLPKKAYEIRCEYPSVNPILPGSNTVGMTPDHTGGGGAPTSVTGNQSPFNRSTNPNKVVNTGLRSDGELVQAQRPLNLLRHKNTHSTQQQGSMLTDADLNEAEPNSSQTRKTMKASSALKIRSAKNRDNKNRQPSSTNPSSIKLKDSHTLSPATSRNDSHDRYGNLDTNDQLQRKSHRSIQPIMITKRVASTCSQKTFPPNAIIIQSGKQKVAECVRGKIVINKIKKVIRQWKRGDPIFKAPNHPKQPNSTIRIKPLTDEMPEDLPAG